MMSIWRKDLKDMVLFLEMRQLEKLKLNDSEWSLWGKFVMPTKYLMRDGLRMLPILGTPEVAFSRKLVFPIVKCLRQDGTENR